MIQTLDIEVFTKTIDGLVDLPESDSLLHTIESYIREIGQYPQVNDTLMCMSVDEQGTMELVEYKVVNRIYRPEASFTFIVEFITYGS